MKTVLVTGSNGQLAKCISAVSEDHHNLQFIFANSLELNITKQTELTNFFKSNAIDWCINCAAYTAVDNAESEIESAKNVNTTGAKFLAEVCENNKVNIVHISTDFVFEGVSNIAYKEDDKTNPLSVYGKTKRDGEIEVVKANPKHFIIRTSWLYSEYNNNFMKTMLRLSKYRNELSIVADQLGTPTYAGDLAQTILEIINQNSKAYGVYHYSNEGVASWYDFAKAVFEINGSDIKTFPINSESYPTPAKRPYFSVLDKTKIKKTFNISIPYWRDSLKKTINNICN
jgi:dTDP-4-dehydrorhamnose reductase